MRPLKIILVNYRYFLSGGPERYLFNITDILKLKGHEVIPFSVKHNKNQPTEYERYFIDPVGTGNEVYGHEYKRDIKTSIKVVTRIIYSLEAKKKMKKLIEIVKPDLIYIVHFQNKLSCSVVDAAKDMNIPVVQRISDFGHICQNSNQSFYLYSKNEICERCLKGSVFNSVKNKCADNSVSHSVIKAASLVVMRMLKIKDKIDAFVFPSAFTMGKYIEFGVKPEKAKCIPTFFNKGLLTQKEISYENYAIFIGRFVPEKGLLTLINAFEGTDYNLKIIGSSPDGVFEQQMNEYLGGKRHRIEFLGEMNFSEIQKYLSSCLFTIVPSEWYENQPNTVLESYAFKKCVVATNIGSLKEAVIDGTTGLLFDYKSPASLREKIEILFTDTERAIKYGENGFDKINSIYSSEVHYNSLITLFNKVLNK